MSSDDEAKVKEKVASLRKYSSVDAISFTFECIYSNCHKKFSLTNSLYEHIRNDHDSNLICPICNEKFKCMASLCSHTRTHTGEAPYLCPFKECEFSSATKGNFKAHLLRKFHRLSKLH